MIRQCVADMKVTETACGASAASGQEGERLNVWQEGDVPEIFPEGSCKRWESVFSE